jgi:hypothetical protein
MKQPIFWSFLIAFVVMAGEQAPLEKADDFLDLVPEAAPRQISEGRASRPRISRGPGFEGIKPLTIKITLLSIDQTSYTLGDPATFEVSLENIGPGSLTIPWGAPIDLERIDPGPEEPPGFLTATIKLSSNGYDIASSVVYGSRLSPKSLRSLKPGERVRVRVHSKISNLEESLLDKLPADVDLKARFDFRDGIPEGLPTGEYRLPAVSANSIRVHLTKHEVSPPQ